MKYRVAQRHFRRALRGVTLTPDVERQGEFVRLAFDEYGLNRHTDAEPIAKANLAAQIAKFETMCAAHVRQLARDHAGLDHSQLLLGLRGRSYPDDTACQLCLCVT